MIRDIHLRIDDKQCRACRRCLAAQVCKVRAIVRLDPNEPSVLEVSGCYDCRLCLPACLFGAILWRGVSSERVGSTEPG